MASHSRCKIHGQFCGLSRLPLQEIKALKKKKKKKKKEKSCESGKGQFILLKKNINFQTKFFG